MFEEVTRKEITEKLGFGFELNFVETNSKEKINKLSKLLIANFYNLKDRRIKVIKLNGFVDYFKEIGSKNNVLRNFGMFEEEKGVIFLDFKEKNFKTSLLKYRILAFYKNDSPEKRKLIMGGRSPRDIQPYYLVKPQINKGSHFFPLWKDILRSY